MVKDYEQMWYQLKHELVDYLTENCSNENYEGICHVLDSMNKLRDSFNRDEI